MTRALCLFASLAYRLAQWTSTPSARSSSRAASPSPGCRSTARTASRTTSTSSPISTAWRAVDLEPGDGEAALDELQARGVEVR